MMFVLLPGIKPELPCSAVILCCCSVIAHIKLQPYLYVFDRKMYSYPGEACRAAGGLTQLTDIRGGFSISIRLEKVVYEDDQLSDAVTFMFLYIKKIKRK